MMKLISKVLFSLFGSCLVFSCQSNNPPTTEVPNDTFTIINVIDTVKIPCPEVDSLIVKTLSKKNDSLADILFIERYKLDRVRYYLNICLKNPKQDKFLKGWIRRAIK